MANEYQTELDRINQNIADTYSVLRDAGAATPAAATSDNLADTAANISAVLYNKAQSLSEDQKTQARTNIGALAESELDGAIGDALAQAKESGAFDGSDIESITRTAGDGAPGTTDTYTVKLTDGTTHEFYVYNGRDGQGAGDMLAQVYDPQGKKTDVFKYVDDNFIPNDEPVPIAFGGTGAKSAVDARNNLGAASKEEVAAASNKADSVLDKIVSRGEQLVINGNGILGDNTGFSRFIFDGAVTNKSPGSFKYMSSRYDVIICDDFIPVDISKDIVCELDIKSQNGLSLWGAFLHFFDVDKKPISPTNYNSVSTSLTTLTQDLNDGDTVVHFADLSGWNANAPDAIDGFIFWGYTNSFGKVYPPRTYSQNVWSMLFDANGVDLVNNTITLKSPWTKGKFNAGTEVSQCIRNGSYLYFFPSSTKVPVEWLHAKGMYGSKYIRPYADAAYAKIGFLCNQNNAVDTTWFTNVSVKEYVADIDGNAATATKATQDGEGNVIVDTYAKKQDVEDMIGNIDAILDEINGEVV